MQLKIAVTTAAMMLTTVTALGVIDNSQPAMSKERLVELISAHPTVTTLERVPALLPDDFLINFILKHGIKRAGERGHLVETKVSQSADPLAPRVIVFDERTGFSISYNGGNPEQTANQRIDLMTFDNNKKEFVLEEIDFPIQPGQPAVTTSDCKNCHGPNQRPIFAMYPDWPAFYGSDNDELTGTSDVQKSELHDYREFLSKVASQHPRYQPLYSNARVKRFLGIDLYPSFPYRPDTNGEIHAVSRAFSFRPELRLGILYNRLVSQSILQRLKEHANYAKFGPYFLFNLLECNWSQNSGIAMRRWLNEAQTVLEQKPLTLDGGGLEYRQNLALFGLKLNDVDIRYNYYSKAYDNTDASKKVMEVGYIGRYFNSYFDGSATIDELLSGALYLDLLKSHPELKGLATPWGLVAKYAHLDKRFKLDKDFFEQMDRLGKWIHIPFPKSLANVHHREIFTTKFQKEHAQLCQGLEKELKK